jgi:predicted DCC family thiol-disulfide oxidoreductase YuxK
MTERPIVYYDGGCPVCSREIKFYRGRTGGDTCAWVDVTQVEDSALGPCLSRADALARIHVRRADGKLLSGAAAFAEIWRGMPGLRWLGRLLAIPPFGVQGEIAYRLFLRLRRLWR